MNPEKVKKNDYTATEASRMFNEIFDKVYHHRRRIVITRRRKEKVFVGIFEDYKRLKRLDEKRRLKEQPKRRTGSSLRGG